MTITIERVAFERWAVDVALAEVDAADLRSFEVRPGDGEHRVAAVEPDGALHVVVREELEHATGPGAQIEDRAVLVIGHGLEDRCFDDVVGSVERSEFVPPLRDVGEVLLRCHAAPVAHAASAGRGRPHRRGRAGRYWR